MTTEFASTPVRAGSARPLEWLEAEIVELASQLTAASARLVALIGELDAAEGWRDYGMRSTAHWLAWKCGMSLTTGREHVRVARALRDLPQIAAGFAAGGLSFSKVRALTRLATPETEAELVRMAEYATAAQLDRLLANHRRGTPLTEVTARRKAEHVTYHYDDDGSLVGSFRIAPERAMTVVHALDVEAGRVRPLAGEGDPDADPDADREAVGRRSLTDGLVAMCER